MAGILAPVQTEREQPREVTVVNDFTPLSLGIRLAGDKVDVIIERHTQLPTDRVTKNMKYLIAIEILSKDRY